MRGLVQAQIVVTALSEFLIAGLLLFLARTRRRDPLLWMLWLAVAFFACLALHELAVLGALRWLASSASSATMLIALVLASALLSLLPSILATPSPITDTLTTLQNRVAIAERIARALRQAERTPKYGFAILFLDLDRFKSVNDTLGHEAGDRLLVEVAERLKTCVRAGDAVARMGGDEFIVLMDRLIDRAVAEQTAQRIVANLGRPFSIDGRTISTAASIGVVFSNGYLDEHRMLRDADAAMYRAKKRGGSSYEVESIAPV